MAGARHELVLAEPRKIDNYSRCLSGVGSDAYTSHAIGLNRDGAEAGPEHRIGEVDDDTGRIIERLNPWHGLVFGCDLNADAASPFPRHDQRFERGPSRSLPFRILRSRERYDSQQR